MFAEGGRSPVEPDAKAAVKQKEILNLQAVRSFVPHVSVQQGAQCSARHPVLFGRAAVRCPVCVSWWGGAGGGRGLPALHAVFPRCSHQRAP